MNDARSAAGIVRRIIGAFPSPFPICNQDVPGLMIELPVPARTLWEWRNSFNLRLQTTSVILATSYLLYNLELVTQ